MHACIFVSLHHECTHILIPASLGTAPRYYGQKGTPC